MANKMTIVEPSLDIRIEQLLVRRVDAARLLCVSVRLFDDLVSCGQVGRVQIGGVVAFDPDDLRAFIRRAKREPQKIREAIEKLRTTRKSRRDATDTPSQH